MQSSKNSLTFLSKATLPILLLLLTGCLGANTESTAKIEIPSYPTIQHPLNISLIGTGAGIITSTDHNINCEKTCETFFEEGSVVTLTAQAYGSSIFNGWSGECVNTNAENTCTTTVAKATSVSAEFILAAEYMLIVNKAGTGSGVVESTPQGILCGDECSYTYDSGTTITLVPKPENGSQFWGWSGACSGTGVCKITLNSQNEVNAEFGVPENIVAFPGAEGFGAYTSGGRGGDVVYVTNLNANGPGSLNEAFGYNNDEMNKARYILFKVSGVVDSAVYGSSEWHKKTHVQYGNFTYAGHSSPGGIIVQGLSDSCEDGVQCEHNNMIFRHLKSRPDGKGQDDALRLSESHNVMIDHASLARAIDEVMQITSNSNYTIQNSILAETTGEHYDRGGVLIKYSTEDMPNTDISFHHNMFHRIGGRLPQIDCSDTVQDMCEAPNEMNLEMSYNLIWDPASYQLLKTEYIKPWGQKFGLTFNINFINNYMFVRSTFNNPMFASTARENDALFYSGNKMNLYPEYQDLELMFCCNNFYEVFPNTNDYSSGKIAKPHDFPTITSTGTDDEIVAYMIDQVGAFPRDPMDRRYMNSLINKEIDLTNWSERPVDDAHQFDWTTPPPPPLDADDDGMPDDWEICNGLNPFEQDHNNKQLSQKYTGVEGYDNLEVYLNRLSDNLVNGTLLTSASCVEQAFQFNAILSSTEITISDKNSVTLTVSSANSLSQVLINTDQLIEPFSWPSPLPIDIIANGESDSYSHEIIIPESREPGNYQISIRAISKSGDISDLIVDLTIL